jgi:hypothetical protein
MCLDEFLNLKETNYRLLKLVLVAGGRISKSARCVALCMTSTIRIILHGKISKPKKQQWWLFRNFINRVSGFNKYYNGIVPGRTRYLKWMSYFDQVKPNINYYSVR